MSLVLTPEVANAAYTEQAEDVAATAIGLREEELQVEDVAVRILPHPAEPHSAAATFDLVRVRAIVCRGTSDGDTPGDSAFARQATRSDGNTRAWTNGGAAVRHPCTAAGNGGRSAPPAGSAGPREAGGSKEEPAPPLEMAS